MNNSPIDAWIFDLGNTLMSIPDEYDEETCLAEILHYPSSDDVRSIIYRLCEQFAGQTIEQFLGRFDDAVNPERDASLKASIRAAWMQSVEKAALKPGAWQVLDDLRQSGMKLALISNTPPTSHYILDRLDLRRRFDVITFSCDSGFLKPDPRIFKIALAGLKVSPANTIVVGDRIRTDILGGAILGMRTVLVEERLRCVIENDQNYVDAIIHRLDQLQGLRLYKRQMQ